VRVCRWADAFRSGGSHDTRHADEYYFGSFLTATLQIPVKFTSIDVVFYVLEAPKQLQKVSIEHGDCDHASLNAIDKNMQPAQHPRGSQVRIVSTNFADVWPIWVFFLSVLGVLFSVLDCPANSHHPVPTDGNEFILLGVTKNISDRRNQASLIPECLIPSLQHNRCKRPYYLRIHLFLQSVKPSMPKP
jgi:hypothetical protein